MTQLTIECFKCNECNNVTLERKKVCPKCGSMDIVSVTSDGKGKVIDSTIVYFPPDNYKDIAPYTSVFIELDNSCRLFGIIAGEHKGLQPGYPVVLEAIDAERGGMFFGKPR